VLARKLVDNVLRQMDRTELVEEARVRPSSTCKLVSVGVLIRRWGVEIDEVERASEDAVRLRERGWLGFGETGDVVSVPGYRNFDVDSLAMGLALPSCHWRCNMTDFVVH